MNQRGSVILWGLMLCGLIGVLTMASSAYYENFLKQARETQVRSQLTSLESQVRTMAFQPYSYKCGKDANASNSTVSSIGTCALNTPYYQNVTTVTMPGADCASGVGTCGFTMTGPTFTAAGSVGQFHAEIKYLGREAANIAPSIIDLTIPTELLQSASFDCAVNTPNTPVLTGFDASGMPICSGFTPIVNGSPRAPTQPCPKGTYLTNVLWNSLTFQCAPIVPANNTITCGTDMAIQHVTWQDGKMNVGAACGYLPAAPFN